MAWASYTLEQARVQRTLLEWGVKIFAKRTITEVSESGVVASCVFTGQNTEILCNDEVITLKVELIGDALAPGLIADAVFSGHLAAQNFEAEPEQIESALYRREHPSLLKPR